MIFFNFYSPTFKEIIILCGIGLFIFVLIGIMGQSKKISGKIFLVFISAVGLAGLYWAAATFIVIPVSLRIKMSSIVNSITNEEYTYKEGGAKAFTYDKTSDSYNYKYIPYELCASKQEDVRFVLYLERKKNDAGTYSKGGKAYQWEYEVQIVDLKEGDPGYGKVIGLVFHLGGEPPRSKTVGFFGGTGSKPSSDKFIDETKKILEEALENE